MKYLDSNTRFIPETVLDTNECSCEYCECEESGPDARAYAVGVVSLMAYSPEVWMILDGHENDEQLVLSVLDLIHDQHDDLGWVALNMTKQSFRPFEELFDAADDCDLNHEMVVACKASKNGTFLRISGEWEPIFVPEMAA